MIAFYKKFFLSIILMLGAVCSFGQGIKDEELIKFYHLYKYELDNPFDITKIMPECVKKTNLSEARMTEIMQAQAMGRNINLSETEKQELAKLQNLMQKEKDKYDADFKKKIQQTGLKVKRYEEIKKIFIADSNLQQKTYRLVQKQF